jgi:hypothetical protein
MIYPVDFSIKINHSFCTIHSELIFADSVSECQEKAENIRDHLPQHRKQHVHIFIDA